MAGGGIERNQRTSPLAAFVPDIECRSLFRIGKRHVEPAIVVGRRGGDADRRLLVHMYLPNERARCRIHRVHVGAPVAKESDVAAMQRDNCERGTHRSVGFERPVLATGPGVQRINVTVGTGDKDAAAHHGWLAISNCGVGECEGPFQFEPGSGGCVEARRGGSLKPRIAEIVPPAIPVCSRRREIFSSRYTEPQIARGNCPPDRLPA